MPITSQVWLSSLPVSARPLSYLFLKKAARDHRAQTLSWEVGSQFEPGSADPRLGCDCSTSCLLEPLKPGYLNLYPSIYPEPLDLIPQGTGAMNLSLNVQLASGTYISLQ